MDVQNYINQKKALYSTILEYLENGNSITEYNLNVLNQIEEIININEKDEILTFLHILSSISANHFRCPYFIAKIEKIISFFEESIKKNISSSDIFKLFKKDKRILLFLFKKKFIKPDKYMLDYFQSRMQIYNDDNIGITHYEFYFYPEFKNIIDKKKVTLIEQYLSENNLTDMDEFEKKRQIGENDLYICSLIRSDSIEEFDSYINRSKLNSILYKVYNNSIFETNCYLNQIFLDLVDYVVFFGAIKILNYLKYNFNKQFSLENYMNSAIHSKNPEMIHLFEKNTDQRSYKKYIKEAIKCHHNDIARYIQDNLPYNENKQFTYNNNDLRIMKYGFHYKNYDFIPNDLNLQYALYYSCLFNYIKLVKILLKSNDVDINRTKLIQYNLYFFK